MNLQSLKVIYYDSVEIKKNDILWGLLGLGIDVTGSGITVDINLPNEDQIMAIINEVKNFDYAITQDFSVNVAIACHIAKVKYISWIYDAPQVALYTDYALFDENYIFCFDKMQVERMKQRGISHVFHQPLAANTDYIARIDLGTTVTRQYASDISFVGQLYDTPALNSFFDMITPQEKESWLKDIRKYVFNWDRNTNIYREHSEIASVLSKYITGSDFEYYKTEPEFIFKSLIYSNYLSREERLFVLREASARFNTSIYTTDRDYDLAKTISGLNVNRRIKDEIPYQVYHASKLNLNLTIRSIETAAPQRVFDIMGAGGAVISDYREEMAELFVPDKEIILFESIEEFLDKSSYYLERDAKRNAIAVAGKKRIEREYNYKKILPTIFERCI